MDMQKTNNRLLTVFGAVFLAVIMVIMLLPLHSFAAVNQEVTDASKGVLQVNLVYRDDSNNDIVVSYGSGFLINSDTVLTCAHVTTLTDGDVAILADAFGKSQKEVLDRLGLSVTVSRDVTIKVSNIVNQSQEMDWAILKLEQSIQGKSPLEIRSSSDVKQTETVYAIGFPRESAVMQDINTFTSEDVTITDGIVNKVATGTNLYSGANTDYIQTSVKLKEGNSGGPLVDEQGYVVGICEGSTGTYTQDDYFYAVAIDQVTTVLDALGVDYTKAGETPSSVEEPTEEPTEAVIDKSKLESAIKDAEAISAKGYSKESFAALTAALENAKAISAKDDATQEEIDQATKALKDAKGKLEEKRGLDLKWIIIIAAAVVVIAAVIVIILVLTSKKKKQQKQLAGNGSAPFGGTVPVGQGPQGAPGAMAPQGMPQTPPQVPGFTPVAPMPPVGDAGETTVLSSDAGETTVLSQNINGGTLVSVKTGDKIPVNTAEFTIGRERTRVNYCISGNSSVGRIHAKIVNRNGAAYLVDMKATNGTFVNGVKCTPMMEVQLKNGDKIAFSNEEYIYQA